jgi:hypothetical protein
MADLPEWYEKTLGRQLVMNAQTWKTLQEHGVDEERELRLDFDYVAPSEDAANQLASFLRTETDYQAEARSEKQGRLARRTWRVGGQTQPTRLSPSILDDWVAWMVTAGARHGGCESDGWGALVA